MDGMALSMITGKSWKSLISRVTNNPLPGNKISHIGGRAISKSEREFIDENGINVIGVKEIQSKSNKALQDIYNRYNNLGIKKIHIHFDVDSIDPQYAPSNTYFEDNGLKLSDVIKTIQYLSKHFEISSINIASYDAVLDHENKMFKIIEKLITEVLKLVKENIQVKRTRNSVMAN
jgi:arginase family enzyme